MRFVPRLFGLSTFAMLLAVAAIVQTQPVEVVAQQPGPLPADLALVPANAAGFIHIRGADLWKSDIFASFRKTFESAGPKAIATIDRDFVPKPSTFDRLTAFVLINKQMGNQPEPFVILRFTAPFEVAEVVTAYLPKATATKVGGKTVYRGEQAEFELYFPDHQHIVLGMHGSLERYLTHDAPASGPLQSGLKLAASGKPVVVSVNVSALPIPERELAELPAEIKPLLKAEHVTASLDLATAARIELLAGYKNAEDAQAAERAIGTLAEYGRKQLALAKQEVEKKLYNPKVKSPRPPLELPEVLLSVMALGAINQMDELLAKPDDIIKRTGSTLTASFSMPKELVVAASGLAAVGVGLLLPAVQKVREAAARVQDQNNMKQIVLAVHAYADTYGHFPTNISDKNGKPLLSWRVAILPFMEQQNLYNQFKLDEPWDSANNKKWSDILIKTYMSPNADPSVAGNMTLYKGFVGPGTVFEPGKKITFANITDGTSNTILFVESGPPVPWAKPEDFSFDPNKPLPKLSVPGMGDMINVAMCDGSVRIVNTKTVSEKTLKAAITRDGGEVLGTDW
jgi:hypothetical protein